MIVPTHCVGYSLCHLVVYQFPVLRWNYPITLAYNCFVIIIISIMSVLINVSVYIVSSICIRGRIYKHYYNLPCECKAQKLTGIMI